MSNCTMPTTIMAMMAKTTRTKPTIPPRSLATAEDALQEASAAP